MKSMYIFFHVSLLFYTLSIIKIYSHAIIIISPPITKKNILYSSPQHYQKEVGLYLLTKDTLFNMSGLDMRYNNITRPSPEDVVTISHLYRLHRKKSLLTTLEDTGRSVYDQLTLIQNHTHLFNHSQNKRLIESYFIQNIQSPDIFQGGLLDNTDWESQEDFI